MYYKNKQYLLHLVLLIQLLLIFLGFEKIYSQQNNELQGIRTEIKNLETKLKTKENKELSLSESIEDINRSIGLQRKLLLNLNSENKKTEKEILLTEKKLEKIKNQYTRLKKLVKKRIISMYKRGRIADWTVLFSSTSYNKAVVWLKYQKRIIDNDRRNMTLLKEKENLKNQERNILDSKLLKKTRLINAQRTETVKLNNKKKLRNKMLDTVRQDKKYLIAKIKEKREAFKAIKERISREESKRTSETEYIRYKGRGFNKLKGKLNWPFKGKISTKHGRYHDKSANSWYENLGIDIEGKGGEIIKAVAKGRILYITWMRGMGNLILLDHGEGYYTVYGYLDMVMVDKDMDVEAGDSIGRIGYPKSLYGSTLHFEIWNGEKHYNPETWLRK